MRCFMVNKFPEFSMSARAFLGEVGKMFERALLRGSSLPGKLISINLAFISGRSGESCGSLLSKNVCVLIIQQQFSLISHVRLLLLLFCRAFSPQCCGFALHCLSDRCKFQSQGGANSSDTPPAAVVVNRCSESH